MRAGIALDPPEGISRVVSARRVLTEGTVSELPVDWVNVMALSFEISETSVITWRLIRPSVSTTGVKLREIPNFLKLIWVVQTCVTGSQVKPAGTGNSPPAMKVADSPEIAVRLGSASVRTTPALSIARMVAVTEGRPLVTAETLAPLPATSERPNAVNGLLLLKFTTAVP